MDEDNQMAFLLAKRRKLLDMREKAKENRRPLNEQRDNGDLEQQFDGVDETFETAPYKEYGDYDSDDSVKDKNYVPDYDSSCSHVSGSSDSSVRKRKIAQVKRKILSPVRNRKEDDQECITLEDLLNTTANAENFIFTDENYNLWDHGSGETTENSQEQQSTSEILTVAVIHNCDTPGIKSASQKTGQDVNKNTAICREKNREIIPDISDLNDITQYDDPNVTNTLTSENVQEKMIIDQDNDTLEKQSDTDDGGSSGNVMTAAEDGTIFLPHDVPGTSATCDPIDHHKAKEKTRKRSKNIQEWQRVSAKNARAKGSPYHSSVAKKKPDVEGRYLKDPCSCRSKCYEKISPESRAMIFNQFWKISNSWEQRRQFVARNVTKNLKSMMRTTGNLDPDRRKFTHTYSLISNFEAVRVCKIMFLNTLCIGEQFVTVSLEKQLEGGMTIPDLRGRHVPANKTPDVVVQSVIDHIKSYPCYESHYSRQKSGRRYLGPDLNVATMHKHYKERMAEKEVAKELIAKEWIYRDIFNTKFNLSFKLPSVDTCDECDSFSRKIMDVTDETEKEQLNRQKEEHDNEANKRYKLKAQDIVEAESTGQGKNIVLMVDMQKCMATPNLTNTKSFYLRKLWTLNLTIFEPQRNVANNMIWSENIGARGGNEVASCLIRWAEENSDLLRDVECLTIWSDNCAGQNRNTMIIMAYMWLMNKFPGIKVINHKFMLKGHTHMEVDQVHSRIEGKKKRLKTMQIAIPRDWSQFIRTCGGKRKFHVYDMELSHFKDLTTLHKKNGPFVLRKKNTNGDDFKISECVWLQLRKESPGKVNYKYSFEEDFSQISLLRNTSRDITYPNNLPNVRCTQKPISEAKYKDLLKLLEWVPVEYHAFNKNLPYNDKETDFPETD